MNVSAAGRILIENFEGLVLSAYLCPAGVWTIGYGHTAGVKPGDTMTAAEADATLAADLLTFGNGVERACQGVPTSQNQFDAMVSLAVNIGLVGFTGSTVLRLHRAGDTQGAARAFGLWNKATVGGVLQPVLGLTRRRAAEAAIYLTPSAEPVPMPAAVVPKTMPQAVEPPPPVPSGYAETPSGNIVRENVADSSIVKGADLTTKVATVAGTVATATPVVGAVAGMDWKAMLGIAAVLLAGALAFAVWKFAQAKTARIEMHNQGVA